MPDFYPLWPSGPLFAQAEHFKLSTDCVLLSDFASAIPGKRGIDLGCASGAIGLLMLANNPRLHMTGLELVPKAAELAELNMRINGLSPRSEIVCGDIRRYKQLFSSGSFDIVVSNPPYFPIGSGKPAKGKDRAAARAEEQCSLEDICRAAAYLCKSGGSFALVHKPQRLAQLMCTMSAVGIEPKRLRLVCYKAGQAPNLILLQGRRGGKPGLEIEPPLILCNEDSTESPEIRRIYHRD